MSDLPVPGSLGPLDDFLDHPPARPASAGLRDALLLRTTALVRQRRRRRVAALAAAMAAAVVLGAGVVWLEWPGDVKPPGEQPMAHKQPLEPPPVPQRIEQAPPLPPAVALEWQAFDAAPEQQTALYRQAGDRYVEDADDLVSAVRCYGQSVRAASVQDLEIDTNDNWLVMALKADEIERRKEK